MTTNKRTAGLLTALLALTTTPAYAYLDPGTGSMILQGLLAGIAGALVMGRLYWMRIKQFFGSLFGKRPVIEEPVPEEQAEKAES